MSANSTPHGAVNIRARSMYGSNNTRVASAGKIAASVARNASEHRRRM